MQVPTGGLTITITSGSVMYSGFSAAPSSPTGIMLKMIWDSLSEGSVPATVAGVISYSTDSGTTWTTIWSGTTQLLNQTSSVTLLLTQDLTKLQVKFAPSAGEAGELGYYALMFNIYEIWVEVTS